MALQLATIRVPYVKQDGTPSKKYFSRRQCVECKGLYDPREVHVDHMEPIGPPPDEYFSFSSQAWLNYFKRLGGAGNLQVLCKSCHVTKTKTDIRNMRGA